MKMVWLGAWVVIVRLDLVNSLILEASGVF